jgi:RHS repeat-associated protein
MQGAGGVGGLLWLTIPSGSNAGTYFYCFDGNGNVAVLVSAAGGTRSAVYEYGPFGELLRATGPAAALNPFRFSTKRTDNTTDLVLYEYRPYSPTLGQWPNRDPIAEKGGRTLYGFAANDGVNHYDKLGKQFCGYNCMPKDCNGVPDGPIRQTGCDVFIELLRRWRSGSGWSYEIPSDVMDSMMSSGQNAKDIEQMKGMLKQRCRKFRPRGMAMEQIAYESFTSAGAECEAWFLGGHTRTISGIADCCSNRAQICLEVTDKWDFDEQDPYPKGGAGDWAKYLSSICIGAVLDLGTLDWPVPVPVHGKKCIEVKL